MFIRTMTKNRFSTFLIVFILAIGIAATQGEAKVKASPCDESGTLSSNETWTSSCVYVVDNVIVPSGKTLTIDSGTVIKLSGSSNLGIEVDSGGTLDVSGSSGNHVTFTSLNDNTIGGTVSGSSGSPAPGDYDSAVDMNGGTADITYTDFEYATTDINDRDSLGDFLASDSVLTVSYSSFTNSLNGMEQNSNDTVSLQNNAFNLGTSGSGGEAIIVGGDPDVSGIVMTGEDENTFSGSGSNLVVEVDGGTIPSDSSWTVDTSSGGQVIIAYGDPGMTVDGTFTLDSDTTLVNNAGVQVNGTVNFDSGSVIKSLAQYASESVEVNSGGTLDVMGTSDDPVTFTSLNDNTVGGTSLGSSGSPAVNDYMTAITMNGGVGEVEHTNFEYGFYAISDYDDEDDFLSAGSELTVTDSSFANEIEGVSQYGDTLLSLERNSFELDTASDEGYAIIAGDDADLSGIVLTGDNENTFSGSGTNLVVEVSGSVPSDSTWNIDTSSGAALLFDSTVEIGGTVNIDPGVIVKVYPGEDGIDVLTGGILNAAGNNTSPVVFTSYYDSSIGDDVDGNPTSTGTSGDYDYAIRFEDPSDSDVINWVVFKYATSALDLGIDGSFTTLTVENSQFSYNEAALNADTTSVEFGELGSLESDCLYPYPEYYELDNDWFGSTSLYGYPGNSSDLSSYLDLTMPDPSDYPGISEIYDSFGVIEPNTVDAGDNTMPWTLFDCSIAGFGEVEFPVTPVLSDSFEDDTAIASSPLWTDANLEEE